MPTLFSDKEMLKMKLLVRKIMTLQKEITKREEAALRKAEAAATAQVKRDAAAALKVFNKAIIESKAASKAPIESAKALKVAAQVAKTVVYLRLKAF